MIVQLETMLPATATECQSAVMSPALLCHVTAPLIRFEPVTPPGWPARWQPGPFLVRMKLFGLLPLGEQTIDISLPPTAPGLFLLRDNGHSRLIPRWDHLIIIEAVEGGTRYTDRVEIEAGWRTPFVWLFARLFYGHRQRRWRQLVAHGGLSALLAEADRRRV
jgi:hypothetical protein